MTFWAELEALIAAIKARDAHGLKSSDEPDWWDVVDGLDEAENDARDAYARSLQSQHEKE